MTIHLLPPLLANQIAAGEVVDRPASILKELIENSLDAGATQIQIALQEGGIQLIKVMDNGSGIPPEELPLALLRHATSKLTEWTDLLNLDTFGFRGEALASICAAARLKLVSRVPGDPVAWMVKTEGVVNPNLKPELAPFTPPHGTTVEVQDLFYNLPVRRRYLRSARTEWLRCIDLVRALALVHPMVEWRLEHNDRLQLNLKAVQGTVSDPFYLRLADVWGAEWLKKAYFGLQTFQGYEFKAWLGTRSGLKRGIGACQFQYLNGRFVRDPIIQRAVRQAFLERQAPGLPALTVQCLYIEAPKDQVDINVHPQKEQVRFQQVRWIHGLVYRGVASILDRAHSHPKSFQDSCVTNSSDYAFEDSKRDQGERINNLSVEFQSVSGLPQERNKSFEPLSDKHHGSDLDPSTLRVSVLPLDASKRNEEASYRESIALKKGTEHSLFASELNLAKERIVGIYAKKFGLLETNEPALFMFELVELQKALWRLRIEHFRKAPKHYLRLDPVIVTSAVATDQECHAGLYAALSDYGIEVALSHTGSHYVLHAVPQNLHPDLVVKALSSVLTRWIATKDLTSDAIADELATALRSEEGPLEHVSSILSCMREIESFKASYFSADLPDYFRRVELPLKEI